MSLPPYWDSVKNLVEKLKGIDINKHKIKRTTSNDNSTQEIATPFTDEHYFDEYENTLAQRINSTELVFEQLNTKISESIMQINSSNQEMMTKISSSIKDLEKTIQEWSHMAFRR
jgi:uncharacterized protein YoxC